MLDKPQMFPHVNFIHILKMSSWISNSRIENWQIMTLRRHSCICIHVFAKFYLIYCQFWAVCGCISFYWLFFNTSASKRCENECLLLCGVGDQYSNSIFGHLLINHWFLLTLKNVFYSKPSTAQKWIKSQKENPKKDSTQVNICGYDSYSWVLVNCVVWLHSC